MSDKAIKLTQAKTLYDNLRSMVAVNFDEDEANAAGSYVCYQGAVYLLPDGHTAGTTWANTTKVGPTNIGGEVSTLKSAIQQKITEPETEGTSGQVLTTDGNGGRSWSSVSGGSADTEVKDSTATGNDLDVADANGNVLARFNDGNIRTKKFNSDNGVYSSEIAYTNTSGTESITHFFPAGTRLAFHLINKTKHEKDSIASQTVTYKYKDANGSTHTICSDYGYNFPEYTLTEDAASVSVDYVANLNGGENATLVFKVYSIGDVPRKPTILTVGTGKEYTNLRTALEYAGERADTMDRYEVHIYPGTYDTLSYFTAEEIAESDFIGLKITNGVSLIGIGQGAEIILTATMSTIDYDTSKRNDISTLNIIGNVSVKNLTIKAENIRYACHDDIGLLGHQDNIHYFEEVTFYGTNLTSTGDGNRSFGAGGGNLKKLYFKNCDFSDDMVIHTSASMVHEFTAILENCRSRMMSFSDYNSTKKAHFYLKNCNVARINFDKSGTHDQFLQLEGEGTNGAMITCPAGYVYALGGVHKFFGSNVTAGKGVKLNSTMESVAAADSLNTLYGISIGVANGATYVQTDGWINSNTLGLSGLSVGDYLTINTSTGAVESGTSSNAIAQVKYVDANSVAYAKLML